jgi:hypothetical protein
MERTAICLKMCTVHCPLNAASWLDDDRPKGERGCRNGAERLTAPPRFDGLYSAIWNNPFSVLYLIAVMALLSRKAFQA